MHTLDACPENQASTLTSEVLSLFLTEMRGITDQLSPLLRASITFASGDDFFQIIKDENCLCGQTGHSDGIQNTSCRKIRDIRSIEIIFEDNHLGTLTVCFEESNSSAPDIAQHLAQTAIRLVSMDRQEEALLLELAASWESLGAVYEITSDLRTIQNHTQALDKILDKAASIEDGLRAVLWIEQNGSFETAITRNTRLNAVRSPSSGLLGKAVSQGHAIVLNGRERVSIFQSTEPELALAERVIIAPIATRHSIIGALEIWQEHRKKDFDSRALRLVEAFALQIAMVVENERLYREYIQSERLRQEVEIGSRIQQTLLLGQPPRNLSGLHIASLTIPSQRIDGDFYDFIRHSDHCIDIVIGDVMGKGIPAALFGAATKSQFVRAAGHIISSSGNIRLPIPEEIVALVHNEVTDQFIEFDSFVTICYARFDTKLRKMDYVDCGHTRTVHFQRNEDSYRLLEGENLPIGFTKHEIYRQSSVRFGEGDVFLFYSDGITEAKNVKHEMFGESRLAELVSVNNDLAPEDLLRRIYNDLSCFSESETFADDLTCLAVKITTGGCEMYTLTDVEKDLVIVSELKELEKVRDFACLVCSQFAPSPANEDRAFEVRLALTEAVTNIIKHAYGERPGETICLKANAGSHSLVIRLSHTGESFDPITIPPPAFDGSRDGGFGLFIIASIMDSVEYTRDSDGSNLITMSKQFPEEN